MAGAARSWSPPASCCRRLAGLGPGGRHLGVPRHRAGRRRVQGRVCASPTCSRTCSARACCRPRSSRCTPPLLDEDRRGGGRLAGAVAGLLAAARRRCSSWSAWCSPARSRSLLTPGFAGETARPHRHPAADHVPGHRRPRAVGVVPRHPQQPPAVLPRLRGAGAVERGADRRRGTLGVRRGERRAASPSAWRGASLSAARSSSPCSCRPSGAGAGAAALSLDTRLPEVRGVLNRFGPVVVGRGVVQLSAYVDLILASLLARRRRLGPHLRRRCSTCSPISLFGMAVAAAELPELARLGRQGRDQIRERMALGMERITFYVAPTVAVYVLAGDVLVGASPPARCSSTPLTPASCGSWSARSLRPAGHDPLPTSAERPVRARPHSPRGSDRRRPGGAGRASSVDC